MSERILHEACPVVWLSRHQGIDARGPWDTGMLEHLFDQQLWPLRRRFAHLELREIPDDVGRAVVVLPARHHAADVPWLNEQLAKLGAVLLILCGDEEAIFPWRDVEHPNIRFWVQLPDVSAHGDMPWAYFFGDGWKADTPDELGGARPTKTIEWSFAGQVTNERRKRAVNGLRRLSRRVPGELTETAGFTQGMDRFDYLQQLKASWVAPAPGGPATHDTFRFFEALEAHAIPVVEQDPYWTLLGKQSGAGDHGILRTSAWDDVGGVIEAALSDRGYWQCVSQAWYSRYRREMARRLDSDLDALAVPQSAAVSPTTAVITTSPSPLHPDTAMIDETIESVYAVCGLSTPIVIVADGVRLEQQGNEMWDAYHEALSRVFWWAKRAPGVQVLYAGHHRHQAAGVREAVHRWVDTENVLLLEHDTPLVIDEPIDWPACEALVAQRAVDVLRFHHEAAIHPEHEHLMVDHETIEMMGVPLRRTNQWSQRPHLASTMYYRRMLQRNFSTDARCFIEDRMHSVAQQYPREHRIAIYHPDGNIKRSYHLDGRQGGPKYDDTQVF